MTSSRWVVVDDVDSAINYTGPWFQNPRNQYSGLGNLGPTYQNTLHGTKNNASLSFAFNGTSVRVFGTSNLLNNSGVLDPTWDCFVDNISKGKTQPFEWPENNWMFCEEENLMDGPHTLTVNVTVMQAQPFLFDDIQYVPSASVSLEDAAVRVDSSDSELQYGAGWITVDGSTNSKAIMTRQVGSNVTFHFFGVSLSWYGLISSDYSLAATTSHYSVDGGDPVPFTLNGYNLPASTSPYEASAYNQNFFNTSNMTAGHHKLVVTYLGNSQNTPLILDYLIVQNGTTTNSSTAGTNSTTAGTNSTTAGTHPTSTGAPSAGGTTNNIGPIVGSVVGGVLLIALAIFAFYIRRRNKRSNGEQVSQLRDIIEPFHCMPVSTPLVSLAIPSASVVTYPQIQSGDPSGRPGHAPHGSMPSLSHTAINASTPGVISSAAQYVPYNSAGVKVSSGAAATAADAQPQPRAQYPLASPPLSDDSGSRVVLHEDSGIRLPENEPPVMEIPPVYTPR